MNRAAAEAARLQRIAGNVPKVSWHRQTKWSFACPQTDGAFYADYPTPEAAYQDWKAHCAHRHPGLPVGWPPGTKGPPLAKQPPSGATGSTKRPGRQARPVDEGQESLW